MENLEEMRKDAWSFLNNQVKAQRLMCKTFRSLGDIRSLSCETRVHIFGFLHWCQLLGMDYIREDWEGNRQCSSNWDIVYFVYKGVTFFELVCKEDDVK